MTFTKRKKAFAGELPYKNIITFQKNSELPCTYDVEMNNISELKRFSSIECHIDKDKIKDFEKK